MDHLFDIFGLVIYAVCWISAGVHIWRDEKLDAILYLAMAAAMGLK